MNELHQELKEQHQSTIAELNQEIDRLKAGFEDLQTNKAEQEGLIQVLNKETDELKMKINVYESDIVQYKQNLDEMIKEKSEMCDINLNLTQRIDAMQLELVDKV